MMSFEEFKKKECVQYESIPISKELEEASKKYALNNTPWDDCVNEIQESFKAGAKWQREQMQYRENLEVKEVDLNIEEELKKYGISSPKTREICIASHFYELGLKARQGE